MGRSDRPKDIGRFTAAGTLTDLPTWTPQVGDDPAEVTLAALQRHLLHDLPSRHRMTNGDLAMYMGVSSERALAPYLSGERALETEHVLRLLHAFNLSYADLPLAAEAGSAALLPAAYAHLARRTGTPGRLYFSLDQGLIDWAAVAVHIADAIRGREAAHLLDVSDDGAVLLDAVIALRDTAALMPEIADRVPSDVAARVAYQGAADLTVDAILLPPTAAVSDTGRVIRALAQPGGSDHITVLVARRNGLLRLLDRFPTLRALREPGDAAALDSRDLHLAGADVLAVVQVELVLAARVDVTTELAVLLLITTKATYEQSALE